MRAELPSGKLPTAGYGADLPVQPLDHLVGADESPVFIGKITVGQGFLNAIVHLLVSLLPFHGTEFLHRSFGLLSGGFLALLGMDGRFYAFSLKNGVLLRNNMKIEKQRADHY